MVILSNLSCLASKHQKIPTDELLLEPGVLQKTMSWENIVQDAMLEDEIAEEHTIETDDESDELVETDAVILRIFRLFCLNTFQSALYIV